VSYFIRYQASRDSTIQLLTTQLNHLCFMSLFGNIIYFLVNSKWKNSNFINKSLILTFCKCQTITKWYTKTHTLLLVLGLTVSSYTKEKTLVKVLLLQLTIYYINYNYKIKRISTCNVLKSTSTDHSPSPCKYQQLKYMKSWKLKSQSYHTIILNQKKRISESKSETNANNERMQNT